MPCIHRSPKKESIFTISDKTCTNRSIFRVHHSTAPQMLPSISLFSLYISRYHKRSHPSISLFSLYISRYHKRRTSFYFSLSLYTYPGIINGAILLFLSSLYTYPGIICQRSHPSISLSSLYIYPGIINGAILLFLSSLYTYPGIINGAILLLQKEYSLSPTWVEGIVSSCIGAAAIFSFFSGIIADALGRKVGALIINCD